MANFTIFYPLPINIVNRLKRNNYMPQTPQQPDDPYKSILAQPGEGLSVRPDINLGLPKVREAFQRAAQGKDVVNRDLTDALVGSKTSLNRSNFSDTSDYDFTSGLTPMMRLSQLRSQRPLTQDENKQLEKEIKHEAKETGLKEDFIRSRLAVNEAKAKESDKKLSEDFGFGYDKPLEHQIGEDLIKRVHGTLSPAENARLEQNIRQYQTDNKFTPDAMQSVVESFEKRVRDKDQENLDDSIKDVNVAAVEFKKGPGAAYEDDFFNVGRFSANYNAFGFTAKDPPGRPPPLTKEQSEFIVALHESEHAMAIAGRNPIFKDDYKEYLKQQAREIDADSAIVKFLNDAGEKDAKNYYLQSRNVTSYMDGLAGDFDHDTSTFLRVQENTGQQIDLDKFRSEKQGLVRQIANRFEPSTKINDLKVGDVMGAVQDVLKDDREHPEKNLLTPLQKAEAEQYLADADALGFKANPNYPKPPAQPDPSVPQPPPSPPPLQQNGPRLGS